MNSGDDRFHRSLLATPGLRVVEPSLYIAPVTLGSGAPLLPRRVELRLEELGRNRDFACARYAVVRA